MLYKQFKLFFAKKLFIKSQPIDFSSLLISLPTLVCLYLLPKIIFLALRLLLVLMASPLIIGLSLSLITALRKKTVLEGSGNPQKAQEPFIIKNTYDCWDYEVISRREV